MKSYFRKICVGVTLIGGVSQIALTAIHYEHWRVYDVGDLQWGLIWVAVAIGAIYEFRRDRKGATS